MKRGRRTKLTSRQPTVRRIATVQGDKPPEGHEGISKYYAVLHSTNTRKPQGLADRGNGIKGGK